MQIPNLALGGIVESNETKKWVRRDDFLQMLDTCTKELGITHLDTAQGYVDAEEVIGEWLREQTSETRDRLFIATKVVYDLEARKAGKDPKPYTKEYIHQEFKKSLQKLGVEKVDLYYIHGPHPETNDWVEIMGSLNDLAKAGQVKAVGISNIHALSELDKIYQVCETNGYQKPTALQNEMHPIYQEAWRELIPRLKELDTSLIAFSPLASGTLSGKYEFTEKHSDIEETSRWGVWKAIFPPPYWNADMFNRIDKLKELAGDLGHSCSSLTLAWSLFHPDIQSTLLGPRVPRHLDAAKTALEKPIDQSTFDTINQIFSGGMGSQTLSQIKD